MTRPNQGSLSAGSASVRLKQVEVALNRDAKRSCCARNRKCIGGCSCCCLLLVAALGVAAYFFWPRMLTVCAHYGDTTARVRVELDPSSSVSASGAITSAQSSLGASANASASPYASASIEFVVPISINSTNLWGITVDVIRVTAFYNGNRAAALARGAVNGFSLEANGITEFEIALSPPDAATEQTSNVLNYLVRDCGPLLSSGVWLLDLYIEVSAYGFGADFWIEDMEMPCATTPTPVRPSLRVWNISSDDECGRAWYDTDGRAWPDGQYCKALLCGIDDIQCEKLEESACPQPPNSPPPPHSPPSTNAPPPPVGTGGAAAPSPPPAGAGEGGASSSPSPTAGSMPPRAPPPLTPPLTPPGVIAGVITG